MTDDPSQRAEWLHSVLEEFEGPLMRYAVRLTGDVHRARDAVQETFLRLCGQQRSHLEGHLAQWLFAVCRSRAIDAQRKESRMSVLSNGADSCPSRDRPPAEVLESEETSRRVLEVLATLPANQQEVIRLKFQNGLSYAEISRVTSLSTSHVGVLIHTAVKTLRRRLQTESGLSQQA